MRGLGAQVVPVFLSPLTNKWYILEGFDATTINDLSPFVLLRERADLLAYPTVPNVRRYLFEAMRGKPTRFGRLHRQLVKIPFLRRRLNNYTARFACPIVFAKPNGPSIRLKPALDPGDQLVLFGTPWNAQASYENFLAAVKPGVEKIFLVYDLIPLNSPFVPDDLQRMFYSFIPMVLRHATSIIVNSDSAASDLRLFANTHGFQVPAIRKINLAHHLPPAALSDYTSLRVRKLSIEKFTLCVGSIESRKNHLNLLVVWSRFVHSESYGGEKLVIAGSWAWDFGAIQNFLHETGHVRGSVIVIEHASDDELRKLYIQCRFTAYPSHYEGWGLPVGESLSFGKPCIHFDNSSLREAGCGLTDVVPYHDLNWFYRSFCRLMTDDRYYEQRCAKIRRNAHQLRYWSDFSSDVRKTFRQTSTASSLLRSSLISVD